MSDPFIGEIRMFGGNFAPAGWALCEGQLLAISENDALFTLIGTTYGGDGQTTFALPDLRGRLPIHAGTGPGLSPRTIGEQDGVENVTLTNPQLPLHTHVPQALSTPGTGPSPSSAIWASTNTGAIYRASGPAAGVTMNTNAIAPIGGSQPHTNMQPYLCINFIISLYGIFPTQS
jgi:microcystin-dependent protein